MSDTWETFCDESYYHLWRVRRKNERNFDDGYHLQQGEEARALVALLNRLEAERDKAQKSASGPSLLQHFDAEELVHASFRYYLGRRTIATSAFAHNLAAAWPHLSEVTRVMIGRELTQAYDQAARNPDWQPLGADCDREAWDTVRDAMGVTK